MKEYLWYRSLDCYGEKHAQSKLICCTILNSQCEMASEQIVNVDYMYRCDTSNK